MKFEIGKCYAHSSGEQMKIVGIVQSYIYGFCLIGEHIGNTERFFPIGVDEVNAMNWKEITESKLSVKTDKLMLYAWCDICKRRIPNKEIHGSMSYGQYHLPGLSKTAHDIEWKKNESVYYTWCNKCQMEILEADVIRDKIGPDYHNCEIDGISHTVISKCYSR